MQDTTLNDFITVAAMVARTHSPGVYTVAMQYVIRLACPHEAGKVAQYAELLRKCMTDTGGRDDQWSVAGKVQEAVATWGSAYPVEELEFMAAGLEQWHLLSQTGVQGKGTSVVLGSAHLRTGPKMQDP